MELRLLVIRTSEPEKLAKFYSFLGLTFEVHQHENLLFNYSTTIGSTILEIQPFTNTQKEVDKNLRLGFGIDNWDEVLWKLQNEHKVKLLIEPTKTDFGFMTIIEDPDGRKIELYRKILKVFKIKINQFIDDHQPGWVECNFFDVFGKEHTVQEKVPVVTVEQLDRNSVYPKEGVVACEIIKEWKDKNEKTVYTVRSTIWGIETIEGLSEFNLFAEQLSELVR